MKLQFIVAILAIAAMPVCVQAQQSIAKLKEDAQNVVKIISSDKSKSQTYCQMVDLNDQADQATDEDKAEELARKATELGETLGPEYAALLHSVEDTDIDEKSQDEIGSILSALDELCEH
jgi:hypothetical protein